MSFKKLERSSKPRYFITYKGNETAVENKIVKINPFQYTFKTGSISQPPQANSVEKANSFPALRRRTDLAGSQAAINDRYQTKSS